MGRKGPAMPLGAGADKRQLAALLEAQPSKTPLLGQVSTEDPEMPQAFGRGYKDSRPKLLILSKNQNT